MHRWSLNLSSILITVVRSCLIFLVITFWSLGPWCITCVYGKFELTILV
uniref:Uncharacterized protein n=1 Tax=Arundo donax TaxID=35708 RepID=A0A0A8YHP4_ARUDO